MKIYEVFKALLLLTALLVISNCGGEGKSSSEVSSNEITAYYEVTSTSAGTAYAIAHFSYLEDVISGSIPVSDRVFLDSGDTLTAEVNGVVTTFAEGEDFTYEAELLVGDSDTEIHFVLTRETLGETLISSVTLPAPFSIVTPLEDDEFGLNDNIILQWSPDIGDQFPRLCISSTCYENSTGGYCGSAEPVDGQYQFSISSYFESRFSLGPVTSESSCVADLELRYFETGTISDGLIRYSSSINARQARTVQVNITIED